MNKIISLINEINNQSNNENLIDIYINNNSYNNNEIINEIIDCLEIIKSIPNDQDFINIFSKNKNDTLTIIYNIFQIIYLKNINNFQFNLNVSNQFTNNQLTNLLNPIFNINLNLFLEFYKIIIKCKIKSNDKLTIENISEIKYFYNSLKLIIMKHSKLLKKNRQLIKLVSLIIIELNDSSINGLIKIEEMLPKPLIIQFNKFIIEDLSTIKIINTKYSSEQYNEIILIYIKVIKIFWNNNQLTIIQKSIEEMFQILLKQQQQQDIQEEEEEEEIAITGSIINILNISPIELIPLFINIIDNGQIKDNDLLQVISKITKYPLTFTNSKWILETFNSLIKSKKTTLLASIVIECSDSIIRQMFILELLPSSYEILEKMLLSYQHSPDIFHSIIKLFPIVIEFLSMMYNKIKSVNDSTTGTNDNNKMEIINYELQLSVNKILKFNNSASNLNFRKEILLFSIQRSFQPSRFKKSIYEILNRFVRLSNILMYHHTGYPELYSDLIQLIQKISNQLDPSALQQTEFEMKKILEENAWSSLDSLVFENIKLKRVLTDRAGLINLGNTCYMNSFLQALYMTIPFRELLLNKIDKDLIEFIKLQFNQNNNNNNNNNIIDNNNEEQLKLMEQRYSREILKRPQLLKQIQLLFAKLRLSIKESISPDQFLQCLPIEYQSGLQHDSFEFGKSLLDSLDLIFKSINKEKEIESKKYPQKKQKINQDQTPPPQQQKEETVEKNEMKNEKNKESSEIFNIFGGKLSTKTICRNCKNQSIKTEEYLELSLSFQDYKKESYTLEELIEQFLKSEEMIGDNKYHCEKCNGLQDADKIIELNSTPNHLILGINRFYFSRESKSISKLLNNLNYPLELNLPYHNNSIVENNQEKNEKDEIQYSNYSLYALIMHSGRSPNHGHYYCYSKPSNSKQLDWCCFNDSIVQISDINAIQNISKRFYTDVPYILFYVKNDTIKQQQQQQIDSNSTDDVTIWIKKQIENENQLLLNKYQNNNKQQHLLEQFHVSGKFNNK